MVKQRQSLRSWEGTRRKDSKKLKQTSFALLLCRKYTFSIGMGNLSFQGWSKRMPRTEMPTLTPGIYFVLPQAIKCTSTWVYECLSLGETKMYPRYSMMVLVVISCISWMRNAVSKIQALYWNEAETEVMMELKDLRRDPPQAPTECENIFSIWLWTWMQLVTDFSWSLLELLPHFWLTLLSWHCVICTAFRMIMDKLSYQGYSVQKPQSLPYHVQPSLSQHFSVRYPVRPNSKSQSKERMIEVQISPAPQTHIHLFTDNAGFCSCQPDATPA